MIAVSKIKGQRSENIGTIAAKLIEIVGQRINAKAYDVLGQIERVAAKQRKALLEAGIAKGIATKTKTGEIEVKAHSRSQYKVEWIA